MVKKAYLYSKNNKLHRGYEDLSLLSIFSKNLIVLGSSILNKFRHRLKGEQHQQYISERIDGVTTNIGNWSTSEANTLRKSANNQKHL